MQNNLEKKIEEAYNSIIQDVKKAQKDGTDYMIVMKSGRQTSPLYLTKNGNSINFSTTISKVTSLNTIFKLYEQYPTYEEFREKAKADRSQHAGGYNNYHWAVMNEIWKRIMNNQQESLQFTPILNPVKRNYTEEDARKRELGSKGEVWVCIKEKERLEDLGRKDLAEKVEHVAQTKGDGLGYDVLSFEKDGTERYREVKTTTESKCYPFYVTRNELNVSKEKQQHYYLYRVYEFDETNNTAKFEIIEGCKIEGLCTNPTAYEVHLEESEVSVLLRPT